MFIDLKRAIVRFW